MVDEKSHRDEFIRREYGQGRMSAREIADALGVSRGCVSGRARVLGLQAAANTAQAHQRLSATISRATKGKPKRPKEQPFSRRIPKAAQSKPQGSRAIKNPLSMQVLDRGRPAETFRVIETVAAKTAPKDRLCSWRTYESDGRSMPCCEPAKPGHMWCASCLGKVKALKESA